MSPLSLPSRRRIAGGAWLCLSLLVVAGGCTRHDDPRTAAYWAERAAVPSLRSVALQRLGTLQDAAQSAPLLLHYLAEPGPWQVDAVRSLRQLGWQAAVPDLLAHLQVQAQAGTRAGDQAVQLNAEIAAAMAPLKAGAAAFDPLVRLLRNPAPRSRLAAIEAVGALRVHAAAPQLIQVAQDHSQPAQVLAALQALGELRATPAVPLLLKSLFFEPYAAAATVALQKVGRSCLPQLMETFKHQNPAVEALHDAHGQPLAVGLVEQRTAAVVFFLRAEPYAKSIADAVETLSRRFAQWPGSSAPPASLRASILSLCAGMGELGDVGRPALLQLLEPPPAPPRAPEAKGQRGGKKPIAVRLADWDAFGAAAALALSHLGPTPACQRALLAALPHAAGPKRTALLVALSRLGDAEVADAYDRLLGADAKASPRAALLGRQRLAAAKACGKQLPCWRKTLQTLPLGAQERAATTLGHQGDRSDLASLRRLLPSPAPTGALAVVGALHRLAFDGRENLVELHDQGLRQGLRDALALHGGAPAWREVDLAIAALEQRLRAAHGES